jgi:hypothetical protein
MIYEFNVGLMIGTNDEDPINSWGNIQRRAGEIRSYVHGQTSSKFRFHTGEEPTLVFAASFMSDVHARNMADKISRKWGQDCVAVRNGLSGKGWLVGPNAAAWGDYQDDLFVRFGR